jgi:hypothetical protein
VTDAMVKPGRCVLRCADGFGGSSGFAFATDAGSDGWSTVVGLVSFVSSAVVVLSLGVVGSGVPVLECFGGSAFATFGASAELSELDLLPEGDGSSAWATPPANPTATQADSRKAATISRSHTRFVDNCTPLAR